MNFIAHVLQRMNLASLAGKLVLASLAISQVAPAGTFEESLGAIRRHEVYQPEIQRGYVVESSFDGLPYNHCPTVMWFGDRWFCAWNGNDQAIEGTPGLQIHMSTSVDGRNWSAPFAPFSDPERCETPYRLPEGKQWQPGFVVVDGELWCFFAQHARKAAGQIFASKAEERAFANTAEEQSVMFGRLQACGGKWAVRRLELGDGGKIRLLDQGWSAFPSQNPVRLRSGRVLVPVVLLGEDRAPDAPDNAPQWWGHPKRASVISSDDGGKTWQVSAGCAPKDRTWLPWEPTVWEQSDGSVAMVFRNNSHPRHVKAMPRSSEFLLGSVSRDGGKTWAEPEHLPIETICSRMYVFPLDGEGVWRPIQPAADWSDRLWLMLHNDFPGGTGWTQDRRDLALFFQRGDGFEFTAGPAFCDSEHRVCYPMAAVHGGVLLITYTQSFLEKRSIRYATVSPPPDPKKRYLLPRADVVRSPRPKQNGAVLQFEGTQFVASRSLPALGAKGLALAAWIRADSFGTLLDLREPAGARGPGAGVNWGVRSKGPDRVPVMYLQVSGSPRADPELPIRQGEWTYVGIDMEADGGLIRFYVDGRSVEIPWPKGASRILRGASARIGSSQAAGSAYLGDVRFLGVLDGPLGTAAHRALHDRFAGEFDRNELGGGAEPAAERLLWLDPAEPDFASHFVLPSAGFQGVRAVEEDGARVLRFTGEGSAGVDLDANHRAAGDAVSLRFRFKPRGGKHLTVCTVGDADEPARVQWDRGMIKLAAGEHSVEVGNAPADAWSELEIHTAGGFTEASVNGSSFGRVSHRPKGTWIYLGQGYRTGRGSAEEVFLVEVRSVRSQVRVADQAGRSGLDLGGRL